MKKILSILAIFFLFSSLFVCLVPSTSATTVLIFEANYGGSTTHLYNLHPTAGTGYSSAVEIFNSTTTGYVNSMEFSLSKYGSPGGQLQAVIYGASTGTLGTNMVPNATLLATSTTILDMSTLTGASTRYSFTFNGSLQIIPGQVYAVGLIVVDVTNTDSTNYARSSYGTGAAGINSARYYSSSWNALTGDIAVWVYGDTSAGVTPTPTPAPTASTGDADMEALTAAILPFLVPLLVCLIPALLGYKFVGELGFFIGLNVGVVLAKVTLEGTAYAFPLWGIILVGVMDVAVVLMRR